MAGQVKAVRSSGNIFADLGFQDPHEEEIKARLTMILREIIASRGLSQVEAAKRMGISQPDLSKLVRGRVLGFSLERMLDCLRSLGNDIEIRVKPTDAEHGKMVLECA